MSKSFCPLACYLGRYGFCLELALRPGVQHSAKETDFNLERVIPMAQRLSASGHGSERKAPLLARLDSGFDSVALMGGMDACNQTRDSGLRQLDWLIKWNPRSTNVEALAQTLTDNSTTTWATPRAGKRLTLWEQSVVIDGVQRPVRRVLRLIERTIDAKGQMLLASDYTLEGWTTTRLQAQFGPQVIIDLYADHGTHEQFHSEFKTDLDLERLPRATRGAPTPVGKFDTNYLVCQLAALAMNILRLTGQRGLLGEDAPVRHQAKRRRLKTVIQELIYRAGRLIATGRKLILGLGANDRSAKAFTRLHGELFAAST